MSFTRDMETLHGWFFHPQWRSAHYCVPGLPVGVTLCGKLVDRDLANSDQGKPHCTSCTRELARRLYGMQLPPYLLFDASLVPEPEASMSLAPTPRSTDVI